MIGDLGVEKKKKHKQSVLYNKKRPSTKWPLFYTSPYKKGSETSKKTAKSFSEECDFIRIFGGATLIAPLRVNEKWKIR